MKPKFIFACILMIGLLANSGVIYAQTTCNLTINGVDQPGATYTVSFRVWDTFNIPHWETGWSSAGTVSFGLNTGVQVNLNVDDDNLQRWILVAQVIKTYGGTPSSYSGYSATLTTDEYYSGGIPITVHIP
jgi:hypothetical protein